jgi:hypothetical protein
VAQAWDTGIAVLDVSGDEMKLIYKTKVYCGTYAWNLQELIPYNDTTFWVYCQYLPDFIHVYDNVSLATWTGKEIVQLPGNSYLAPFASLYNHVPNLFGSPLLYLYQGGMQSPRRQSFDCVLRRIDSRVWEDTQIDITGFAYSEISGQFISSDGSYIVMNAENKTTTELTTIKASLPSGLWIATLSHSLNSSELYDSYSFIDYATNAAFLLEVPADHLYAMFWLVDYESMQKLVSLRFDFSAWTVYGGFVGWNGFTTDAGIAYLHMSVDSGPEIIYQIAFQLDPPALKLLDSTTFYYEYTHSFISKNGWLYTDTDSDVVSRWPISP